jgi:23S rRNA-/tRNA-specific pseudouridylate synthase
MLPISKRNFKGIYKVNFKSGKQAITTFFSLGHNTFKSIVLAMPLTGRTHQIRLHLKSIGVPIAGDFIYNKNFTTDNIKKIPLYAFSLQFDNFIFETKPSNYFISMVSRYNMENILYQFFDKTL